MQQSQLFQMRSANTKATHTRTRIPFNEHIKIIIIKIITEWKWKWKWQTVAIRATNVFGQIS